MAYLCWSLAAAFAVAPLHSQAPAPDSERVGPAIKVETRVVLVDVVVTNHKGETISDLRQEDFYIEEDGKPQSLSAFDEHSRHNAPPLSLPTLPPNVYSNMQAVKPSDSVNVLLIDMLNTFPWFQKDVCNQAIKYLKTVPPAPALPSSPSTPNNCVSLAVSPPTSPASPSHWTIRNPVSFLSHLG